MVFRSHLVCVVFFFNDLKLFASHFLVSEPGLGLRDVNLDAVRTLCGRVLPHGSCPLGRQESLAGLLTLLVPGVGGLVAAHCRLGFSWLLWDWRGWFLLFL